MKRRHLLLGSLASAVGVVVGKNVIKPTPEATTATITLKNGSTLTGKVDLVGTAVTPEAKPQPVTWVEQWNPADGTTYGVIPPSASGYQLRQIAAFHGIEDQVVTAHLLDQPWYQELWREHVLREMYPPMVLTRPDDSVEYIDTPATVYKQPVFSPEWDAYHAIDTPYQSGRKAAMDARFDSGERTV